MSKIEKEKSQPLYEQVKNIILEKIKRNELKESDKIPSMVELSKYFGVSLITVKQAINELVKEGYLETKGAKGTYVKDKKKERTKHISLIFPAVTINPFFSDVSSGIENILKINDFSISVYNTEYNIEKEIKYLKELEEREVKGIIFCPSSSMKDSPSVYLLERLIGKGIPVIFLDIKIEGVNLDYVTSDNFRGGYEATKYLIKLGHKKIAFIISREVNTTLERIQGYKKALEDNGIEYNELLVKKLYNQASYEKIGYVSTMELMNLNNPPTAIISSTDTIAIGIYKACHKLGLKIPDDISVIGYDNLTLSEYLVPSLTTVNQQKYEMGQEAAKILLRRLNGDNSPPINIVLKTTLVKRESCCERN